MGNQLKRLIESFLRNMGGALGRKLRFMYYRNQFKSCGSGILIEEGVFFENPQYMSLGSNIWIDKNTVLLAGPFLPKGRQFYEKSTETIKYGELHLGDNLHIAPFSVLQAHGGLKIGVNVTIAAGSKVYTLSHHYKNLNNRSDTKRYSFSSMASVQDQFLIVGNVVIGDNAAIGLNSVVLPGSTVPNGTWVGVSSIISGTVKLDENSVISGKH